MQYVAFSFSAASLRCSAQTRKLLRFSLCECLLASIPYSRLQLYGMGCLLVLQLSLLLYGHKTVIVEPPINDKGPSEEEDTIGKVTPFTIVHSSLVLIHFNL